MNTSLTLTLATPVDFDGKVIKTITIPKLKGKFMRKLKAGGDGTVEFDSFMVVAEAALASDPSVGKIMARHIMDEMDPADINKVVEFVGEAFAGGPPTGETP